MRLGILISGRGSNFEAIANSIARRKLDAEIAIVISNRADAAGLEIARRDDGLPDAGVLDIDLHGEQVFPLAEALRAHRVPSLFLTGYGPLGVPEPWRDVPHLAKPFDPADLLAVLASIVAGHPTSPRDGVPVPGRPSDLIQKSREVMRHTRNLLTEGRILQEYRGPGKPG